MLPKFSQKTPLAWRQLIKEKARLVVAIGGIAFADVLMFFQLGMLDAFSNRQILLPNYDFNFSVRHTLGRGSNDDLILSRVTSYPQISFSSLNSHISSNLFNDLKFGEEVDGLFDDIRSLQRLDDNISVSPSPTNSFEANDGGFDFEVTVIDRIGDTSESVLNLFRTLSDLALQTWAKHIEGFGRLEVQVNVGGTDAVASAAPGNLFFDGRFVDVNSSGTFDAGDTGVFTASSLLELQTGIDFDGAIPDIIINVNPQFIDDGRFFFDPELDDSVPPDKFDFYSVLLHEVAHGLGFLGLARDLPVAEDLPVGNFLGFGNITAATLFDLLIDDSGAVPVFTGSNSVELYGSGVPLEFTTGRRGSDLGHFFGNTGNDLGFLVDLRLALMNPFVILGDRLDIGALELAVLEDIGHTIVNKADVPFINTFDPLPDSAVPTVTVEGLSNFDGSNLSLGIDLSSGVPFNTIASSVGIEVITSAGAELGGRVLFAPGDFGQEVSLSLRDVFGVSDIGEDEIVSASVNVRLFNPAQAVLEGTKIGSVSEIYTTVELTLGRGTDEEEEFYGSSSDDIFFGGNDEDELFGRSGNDFLLGEGGDDELFGGKGNDTLIGGKGDDELFGGDGDDVLIGGRGGDELSGGIGDDVLIGGRGSDEFIFTRGNDIIKDFNVSRDELELDDFYEDINPTFADTEEGLLITFTETDSILLVGLSATSFFEIDDIFD